jgi:hypothetical protein
VQKAINNDCEMHEMEQSFIAVHLNELGSGVFVPLYHHEYIPLETKRLSGNFMKLVIKRCEFRGAGRDERCWLSLIL